MYMKFEAISSRLYKKYNAYTPSYYAIGRLVGLKAHETCLEEMCGAVMSFLKMRSESEVDVSRAIKGGVLIVKRQHKDRNYPTSTYLIDHEAIHSRSSYFAGCQRFRLCHSFDDKSPSRMGQRGNQSHCR